MVILLVLMGAVFSLLFVLNSIRRAIQKGEKVSFFETLLAFLALVFPVLALVNNNASAQPLPMINMAAIGLGVIVMVVSVITALIEARNQGRKLSQRRGVLGIGVGILIVAATFVAPVAAKLQVPRQAAATVSGSTSGSANVNVSDVAASNSPTPTLTKPIAFVPTNTPDAALMQMSATPTRLASPMPTATNTPFVIATIVSGTTDSSDTDTTQAAEEAPASQSSQTSQSAGCLAVTRVNVNLRSGAASTSDLLLTIPFSTTLNVSAQNKAGDWLFVSYEGKTGWVSGEFVNADATCAKLPVKATE